MRSQMKSKILESYASRNIPVFKKAKEILDSSHEVPVENIIMVVEELILLEKEIRSIHQKIFEINYPEIVHFRMHNTQ